MKVWWLTLVFCSLSSRLNLSLLFPPVRLISVDVWLLFVKRPFPSSEVLVRARARVWASLVPSAAVRAAELRTRGGRRLCALSVFMKARTQRLSAHTHTCTHTHTHIRAHASTHQQAHTNKHTHALTSAFPSQLQSQSEISEL